MTAHAGEAIDAQHAWRYLTLSRSVLRHRLLRFAVGRLVRLVLVLLGVLTLLFFLLRVTGNPAAVVAGPQASVATVKSIEHSLGLDKPLLTQYWHFIADAVRLDFGTSYRTHVDAVSLVWAHLPESLALISLSVLTAFVIALPLGVAGGVLRSRVLQRFLDAVVLLGQAVPIFWLAIMLIWVVSVQEHWLPSLASNGVGSGLTALIQPVGVLCLYPLSRMLQVTRSGLSESMAEDFTRTAAAKGVGRTHVVLYHGLRPVWTTLVSVIGVDLSQMLSGAVLIEVIYSWPGVGQLLVTSVSGRDYPVVETITFLVATLVVIIGFIVDVLHAKLDPRVID